MPSLEGRDRHVRDAPAQTFSMTSVSTTYNPLFPASNQISDTFSSANEKTQGTNMMAMPLSPPLTPASSPGVASPIKSALKSSPPAAVLPRAPLTPCSSSESLPLLTMMAGTRHRASGDSTFLSSVFPPGTLPASPRFVGALPCRPLLAAMVDEPESGLRTLYVQGLNQVSEGQLRDVVVEVLDLADERVEADRVVFVLEKQGEGIRELLQGLLYVGGSVLKGAGEKKGYVLVGIEI